WNTVRENLELNFRFTRRSLAVISLFGLASPILLMRPYPQFGTKASSGIEAHLVVSQEWISLQYMY
ncbi:hypothetical protein ZWY2020_048957, partial [Hordeum vulgare]